MTARERVSASTLWDSERHWVLTVQVRYTSSPMTWLLNPWPIRGRSAPRNPRRFLDVADTAWTVRTTRAVSMRASAYLSGDPDMPSGSAPPVVTTPSPHWCPKPVYGWEPTRRTHFTTIPCPCPEDAHRCPALAGRSSKHRGQEYTHTARTSATRTFEGVQENVAYLRR